MSEEWHPLITEKVKSFENSALADKKNIFSALITVKQLCAIPTD